MNLVNQKKEKEEKEKTLGEKIVEGRRKKGLSQEKFAEKMGCTRQMVSRWELDQSEPRTQKIKKISSILDISIEDLMGENKENKKVPKMPVEKLLNHKVVIKNVLILIITLFALYFLYSGYKLLVLNLISSRVAEYQNVSNYHFKMESYVDKNINEKKEIWYKDGLYKIVETYIVNNIENSSTVYLDVNNGYRYLIDEENKTYSQVKLVNTEQYDDGKYMYTLFPVILNKEQNDLNKISLEFNKVLCYYKNGKLVLTVNDETIKFDKETLLPTYQTIVIKANQTKQENYNEYNIKLDSVEDEDVKVSSDYKKLN